MTIGGLFKPTMGLPFHVLIHFKKTKNQSCGSQSAKPLLSTPLCVLLFKNLKKKEF